MHETTVDHCGQGQLHYLEENGLFDFDLHVMIANVY